MIPALFALIPLHTAEVTYKVADVETKTVRVARYGKQTSQVLTLERDGMTVKVQLTRQTERFHGRRSSFAKGDSVSYDRELKNGMVIDANSLRKS